MRSLRLPPVHGRSARGDELGQEGREKSVAGGVYPASGGALRILLLFAFALVIGQCSGGGCGGIPGCESSETGRTPVMQACQGQIFPCPYAIPITSPQLNRDSIPMRITPTGWDWILKKIEAILGNAEMLQSVLASALPEDALFGPMDVLGCDITAYLRDVGQEAFGEPDGLPLYFQPMDHTPGGPSNYDNWNQHKCHGNPEPVPYIQLPLDTVNNQIGMSVRIYDLVIEIDLDIQGSGFWCDLFPGYIAFKVKAIDVGAGSEYDYCGNSQTTPINDIVGVIDPIVRDDLSPYPSILDTSVKFNDLQMVEAEIECGGALGLICDALSALGIVDMIGGLLKGLFMPMLEDAVTGALAGIFPLDLMGLFTSWAQPTGIPLGSTDCTEADDPLWCAPECNAATGRYYGGMPMGQLYYGLGFYPELDINCLDWPDSNGCPQNQMGFYMPFDLGLNVIEDEWNFITNKACLESIVASPPVNPPAGIIKPSFSSASFRDPANLGNPNNGQAYDIGFGMSQYLLEEILYDLYVSGAFCTELPSPTGGSLIPLIGSMLPIDSFLLNPSAAETIMPAIKKLVGTTCTRPFTIRTIPRGRPVVRVGQPRWQSSSVASTSPPCDYNFVCNAGETPNACPSDCRADMQITFQDLDIDFIIEMGASCIPQRVLSLRTSLAVQVGFDYFTGEAFCPLSDTDSSDNDPTCPFCGGNSPDNCAIPGFGNVDCTNSANAAACCNSFMEYGCANNEFGTISKADDCAACASEDFKAPVSCQGLDNNDGTDDDDTCIQLFVDLDFNTEQVLFSDIGYEPPSMSGISEFLGQVFETALFTCDFTAAGPNKCIATKFSIPGVRLKFVHMGPEPNPTESNDLDSNGANDYLTVYAQFKSLDIIDQMIVGFLPMCGNDKCEDDETSIDCPADCPPPATCGSPATCDIGEDLQNCPQDCFCGNGTCDTGAGENQNPFDADTNPGGCPADCFCGNGVCDSYENANAFDVTTNPNGCQGDCDPVCGNCVCEAEGATVENTTNCFGDCVEASGLRQCGDARCDSCFENTESCSVDCPPETCQGTSSSFLAPTRNGRRPLFQPSSAPPSPNEPQTFLSLPGIAGPSEQIYLKPGDTASAGIGPEGGQVAVEVRKGDSPNTGYTWRLNFGGGQGAWKSITDGPNIELPSFLPQGTHVLEVRGVDAHHHIDGSPASLVFTVDSFPPDIRIVGPDPSGGDTLTAQVLLDDFVDNRNNIEAVWSLDGLGWNDLEDDVVKLTGLPEGSRHTLTISARDASGNENHAASHFLVSYGASETPSCACASIGSTAPFSASLLWPALLAPLFWLRRRKKT